MIISTTERNRRKYQKMLKSLGNKMSGPNILWWDSLSQKAQYALLFRCIQEKNLNPKFKFKHFINKYKSSFKPSVTNSRNAAIEHLINE